ncbi:MAG: Smr/MutS family protein [Bullifex sp.]|nr:Smr/MutS family protein [Spirochaetales bacterium]MDY2816080.1 Smr/MutS family protein [Bullifex sp.]
MGRKKDKRAAVNSRSFKTEEDESIDSPFKNIVLKEKKEEPVKKKPQAVKKKPSEIVQGYDPGASFADILSNWERTGNPYALPHEKKKEASAAKQASFGDILASWDRMNDPEAQRKKKEAKRVSPEYKPTKDFGALLDQYEGKVPQKTAEALPRRKEKDSVSRATFFRQMEEDDERPSSVAWSVFGGNAEKKAEPEKKKETAAPVKKEKRVSKEYKPTKDFGALLDAFEGRKSAETKKETEPLKSVPEERKASEDRKKETEVKRPTFFREREEDDERPSSVAWSVFGDNKPIERPVKAEEPERKAPEEKEKRVSKEYKPTKDFGALLDAFEGRKPAPAEKESEELKSVPEEGKAPEDRTKETEVKKPTFFREREEDDERPATVAWSVFGDNKPIERTVAEPEAEKTEAPVSVRVSEEYKPTKDFGALLEEFEGSKPRRVSESEAPEKSEPEVKKATFFREKEEDDERPATVAWSVFGDNKPIERPMKPEQPERKEPVQEKKPSPPPRVQPRKSRLFSESVKKMPEKTFEEILKEKGEMKKKPREKTLNELRIMLPMATLDLHGMGYTEAEGEVNRFLDEAVSSRIEKVAIIHGKGLHSADGEGVLRELVYSILEARGLVRELTVPKPQYGGSGAVWVILRKQTNEEPSA